MRNARLFALTRIAATIGILGWGAAGAQVQTSADWNGWLRDGSGAVAAKAELVLQGNGNRYSAVTTESGSFHFGAPAKGSYELTVTFGGKSFRMTGSVALPIEGSSRVTLRADGSIALEMEEPDPASGGETLNSKSVTAIPLNKRDFSQLLLLAAGTMTDTNGTANFTQQFAINGQRGVEAVFAMDGADTSDPEMGGATFSNFNVDAVQEIQSQSGWMPAEIGRGAAGFTNIVTRPGTNDLHGSMFEFLRNSALDARNFFDRQTPENPHRIPPFRRNEFGLTMGGPVTLPGYSGRDKTFFFVEYQGFRQVLNTTQVLAVPTADERKGIDATAFSGDTLYVPVNSRIASILSRYPLPNDPSGAFRRAHVRNVVQSGDRCRSAFGPHRSSVHFAGQAVCALHLEQPERTDHEPRPDGDRSGVRASPMSIASATRRSRGRMCRPPVSHRSRL